MNISKHFGGKLIDMEPELEPGIDLNYPVPLSKELPGFSGSGSEPGSITNVRRFRYIGLSITVLQFFCPQAITELHRL